MDRWVDQSEIMPITGIIVPVYFPGKLSQDLLGQLLWMTLADCHHYTLLENVCVVVDGDPRTAKVLGEIRDRLLGEHGSTFSLMPLPKNRGKLWAIQGGIGALLEARPLVEYIVIRDGDGDHVASDVPRLVRTAMHLVEAYASSRVIVIGSRPSRHRPMGWVRGELEELLDHVTIDALGYRLASQGRALNLSHCSGQAVPDLSSGYKVYGRQAAQDLFVENEPQMRCLCAEDYWHYGPETVTIVEGVLQGAIIAEIRRLTWDGQPATTFGEFKQLSLYGELLAWVYARLDIPLDVAAQFYDNHLAARPLRTTAQGRETLASLRSYALERTRAFRAESVPIPPPKPILPFL